MEEEKKEQKPKPFNLALQLDEEIAQGKYVNFAIVNHTQTEFVLDFVFVQPQQPKGKVLSRIIASPVNAKRLALALGENVSKFEQRFGEIKLPAVKPSDPIVH
jgi:hypothetical protein